VPEIRVADYKIESLGLNPLMFGNEDSRKGRDKFIAERPLLYLPMTALVTNCSNERGIEVGGNFRSKMP
jgi:hypothetical protein